MKPKFEPYYKQVGLNVAYYRKLRNLTQMDLAEFTDLSRTHISNIEAPNMKTSISLDTIFSISQVLQIPPKKLLEIRDPDEVEELHTKECEGCCPKAAAATPSNASKNIH